MARRRRSASSVNLVHVIQALEAAGKTSESLNAELAIRTVMSAASQALHHAAQEKHNKIKKSGLPLLGGVDKIFEARRQRKLLDQAAQYLSSAADAVGAVMLRDQAMLDKMGKPKAKSYDPAS